MHHICTFQKLVVALVHSRLNYSNGMLVGIPAHLMRRLQSVLNAAARLIFNLKRSDHITDALVSLHWLRVPERIQYKMAVLSYKVLHDTAPRYLGPLTLVWNEMQSFLPIETDAHRNHDVNYRYN